MANGGGHAKLKRSLLLRDFLAHDLGLRLKDVERSLEAAESSQGVADAFAGGAFLDAMAASVASSDRKERLHDLDNAVRDTCRKSDFVPRYPQYLAVLLMAHICNRLSEDAEKLLDEANDYRQAIWCGQGRSTTEIADRGRIPPFSANDLQIFAFWMATGAGKTHVLHACLALLEDSRSLGGRGFDRIVLIAPSESMSRQHAQELRRHTGNPVFVYPDDGDALQIAHLSRDTILVIDINKLREGKKGEGFTIDAGVFRDSRNLVFVDEGHKGQGSEDSVWKSIQSLIAGIGHPQRRYRGMLIEFSATFGQVAEADHAFDRYAKSVVYDYPYDRFHADLYGKDFDVRNLQGAPGVDDAHEDALAASLVAYWHQLHSWRDRNMQALVAAHGLEIEKPLWVMLGLTVLGKKDAAEETYRSDVIQTLAFIANLLGEDGSVRLTRLLARLSGDAGQLVLPDSAWTALCRAGELALLADTILSDVFHWEPGAALRLRILKRSPGEVGLGLSHGDRTRYFGVVNVGDAEGIRDAVKSIGIVVENDVLTPSLFADLERKTSDIHMLIGSRRFSEGWNNYRASTLTLLRLGSGEGPLIIQMFGRVVRFWGQNRSGKRLEAPPEALRPLQTAYVFGLRADYMNSFLNTLHANGIQDKVTWKLTQQMAPEQIAKLIHLSADEPSKGDFKVRLDLGSGWYKRIGRVELSLATGVKTATMRDGRVHIVADSIAHDITDKFVGLVDFLDLDAIHRRMLDYRAAQGWWNLAFDKSQLKEALKYGTFTIQGDGRIVAPARREDLHRLEGIAVSLLQKMMRSAYRRTEAKRVRYRAAALRKDNEMILEKIFVRETQ